MNNSNTPLTPKQDAFGAKSYLIGFAIAVLFGAVSTYTTYREVLIFESVISGITLFAIAWVLFLILRGIFRLMKSPLTRPGAIWTFLGLIVICGTLVVMGARKSRREAVHQDLMRPISQSSILPVNVPTTQEEETKGNLYRNNKWLFRIRFPEGWKLHNGDGSHVIKKASLQNSGNISVLVRQIPGIGADRIPPEEMLKQLENMLSPTITMLNGQVLGKELVKINNREFAHGKMRVVYENLNGKIPAINDIYLTVEYGHIFLITTSINESIQGKYSSTLKASANSFVIENFDEAARAAGYQI